MELLNSTGMQAGYTMGLRPDGRELLVIAVKGTFALPTTAEQQPQLAEQQVPLIEADTFEAEPGLSAPIYETDYAPYKSRCDVILNGSAYARHAKRVRVRLQIGTLNKSFNVIGDRVWQASLVSISSSNPVPFDVMPISYGRAFGGVDHYHPDENKHRAYMPNPVGCGYHHILKGEFIDNTPLPNTEEIGQPVTQPRGKYRPMAFGVMGRNWEPRYKLAGTYDQNWIDNVFPFLPADFNDAYYQCAPREQQIDYLRGGETVLLENLTPQARTEFQIPKLEVPVVFFMKKGGQQEVQAVADTLVLEPDANRFMLTWRTHLPLKRNMFEVAQVLVGKMSRAWWRARQLGKTYYPSLAALCRAKQLEREDAAE
jgi:hypothetical protein